MRILNGLALGAVGMVVMLLGGTLPCCANAQGTKLWTVSRYDEMERGTTDGVAVRSDGRLEPGPATSLLYTTGGNYVWSVAADAAGNAYVGMGGTAAGGAVVMKVAATGAAAGKAVKVFEGKELGVQALRVLPDGAVLAVTNPDGKVYWLRAGGHPVSDAVTGGATRANGGMYEAVTIFDPARTEEKPKYLWDVVVAGNRAFIATGAPAAIYEVDFGGSFTGVSVPAPKLLFKTADQHMRCLMLSPDMKTLWAGTDGNGVIYKFETQRPTDPPAKPFAVYSAAKREITALAMDSAGNVYAAGVGAKPGANPNGGPGMTGPGLPPLPVTGAVGVTITFSQPGSANAATANTLIPEGSEIYRIAADGSPAKLVTLKEDVVYALAFDQGSLLAATGNRGRVYRVDTGDGQSADAAGRFTDVAHLEAAQGMAFAMAPGGLLVATSNSGKVFRLEDKPAANATYTSEVFDAQGFAQWGRLEVTPDASTAAGFDLFERSGNVESPLMGWSEWAPVSKAGDSKVPGGRYAQWKAVLHPGGAVESVGLNYLEKNVAPVVDEVVVQPGARVSANAQPAQNTTVQVNFPAAGSAVQGFVADTNAQPLMAQKDKTAVTVRWSAHDDNGDDLIFSVLYRGVGERNWRLLKDKIGDKYLSFDSSLLPDGRYEVKVAASDSPDHPDAESLTGERVSGEFVVDTTPPVPGVLTATLVQGSGAGTGVAGQAAAKIHAAFSAKDATSPITHAEYSVDAGPWQYLEPVGKVSDALEERYDFTAAVPAANATAPVTDVREHVLAVRVYDRCENVVSVKTLVR
jgi:hypothetical protein